MIDTKKLTLMLEDYKAYLPNHFRDEQYKWEAVKHFQTHWDLKRDDFGAMFRQATEKTYNLLGSGYTYPRAMILNFANADAIATRQMFCDLADESRDLSDRISAFQAAAEQLRTKYNDGTWRNHYQMTNSISTYLWLMYPDKYYIYKYDVARDVANALAPQHKPKKDGTAASMLKGYQLYDEIRSVLQEDQEVKSTLAGLMDDRCYPDLTLRTATIDLCFYISRFYLTEKDPETAPENWFPADYHPGLTPENWLTLLQDSSVFTESSLQIVKRLKDFGGSATCKQLSLKYGDSPNFYNSGSSYLAKRVFEKTNCPLLAENTENSKWWPILYLGRHADTNTPGQYIWKLRNELSEALDLLERGILSPSVGKAGEMLPSLPRYTRDDFLRDVYMSEAQYDKLSALLRRKKNLILQGAPGVGKSYSARKLAWSLMGEQDDSRIGLVQFHQNYSYEDFVIGYRPEGASFHLREGVFYRFCQTAASDPGREYFFLIDEINRGNLSKIFGELLMLIETDYRNTSIALAYDGRSFSVPENLYLIGMMNTADRSLALIDYALRRRFSFFSMEPGLDSAGFAAYQESLGSAVFNRLIAEIRALNKTISEDSSLGAGFQIGHSYFCGQTAESCTEEWICSVVEYDLLPTLQEYWFDDPETLSRWEHRLRGVFHGR